MSWAKKDKGALRDFRHVNRVIMSTFKGWFLHESEFLSERGSALRGDMKVVSEKVQFKRLRLSFNDCLWRLCGHALLHANPEIHISRVKSVPRLLCRHRFFYFLYF